MVGARRIWRATTGEWRSERRERRERADAAVAGLKVAAFIRWAFSEGTNDRGGSKTKDTASAPGEAIAGRAALVEKEEGRTDISLNSLQKFQSSGQ